LIVVGVRTARFSNRARSRSAAAAVTCCSTAASFSRTAANESPPLAIASTNRSRAASATVSRARASSSFPVARAAARRNAWFTAVAIAARFFVFIASVARFTNRSSSASRL
jgi:hypothetical protein